MIYINITISVASKVGGGATLKIRNLDKQKKKGGITVMLLSDSSKTILNKQNKQNKQIKKSCNY